MLKEIPNFAWDEEDELALPSAKAKVAKKPTAKDTAVVRVSIPLFFKQDGVSKFPECKIIRL